MLKHKITSSQYREISLEEKPTAEKRAQHRDRHSQSDTAQTDRPAAARARKRCPRERARPREQIRPGPSLCACAAHPRRQTCFFQMYNNVNCVCAQSKETQKKWRRRWGRLRIQSSWGPIHQLPRERLSLSYTHIIYISKSSVFCFVCCLCVCVFLLGQRQIIK